MTPPTNSRPRRLLSHLKHWDFLLSVLGATGFAILLLTSDRPLEDSPALFGSAIALAIGLLLGAGVVSRNLSDLMHKDSYGELVRAFTDKEERRAHAPHRTVQFTCLATIIGGVLLSLSRGEMNRTWTALAYSIEAFLVFYSVFGFFDLMRIDARHRARRAKVQGTQEDEARRRRDEA